MSYFTLAKNHLRTFTICTLGQETVHSLLAKIWQNYNVWRVSLFWYKLKRYVMYFYIEVDLACMSLLADNKLLLLPLKVNKSLGMF